jgi:hypothetical protein
MKIIVAGVSSRVSKSGLILGFSLFFSLVSYAKIPIYQSKNLDSLITGKKIEFFADIIDEPDNLRFGIANNDTSLCLQVLFSDRRSLMKFVSGGLTIFFDPSGKKKRTNKIIIEKDENQKLDIPAMMVQMRNPRVAGGQNLTAIVELVYNKVKWITKDNEFDFYRSLTKSPIRVEMITDKPSELLLEIVMPLKELALSETTPLSIGIETGTITMGGMSGSPSGGNMSSGSAPGGGGMGGRGGGGGGGGRSGSQKDFNGVTQQGGGSSSAMEPVKLWFQVQM